LKIALYYGPSPVPILWASLVRFFPFAVALLWPIVRQLPRELRDAARVDGATTGQEFRRVAWPLLATASLSAGLAVAILSLGEVSAGKLVETPGTQSFTHELFNQMHYGVTNNVVALCLVLLVMVFGGGSLLMLSLRTWQSAAQLREP
jgi:ABC-type Fe3+ transport system permease subunit